MGVDDIEICLEIVVVDLEWFWVILLLIMFFVYSGIYGNYDKVINCFVIVIKIKCIIELFFKIYNWFIFNDYEVFKDYLEWGVDKFEYGIFCKCMM